MNIRELEKEDIEQVENIYELYWSGDFKENISKRLHQFIENSKEITDQNFHYFVCEELKQIHGVIGFRKCPKHMLEYTNTINPTEIYILAVKERSKGIGRKLIEKVLDEAINLKYTEVVLYSGESHSDSWGFYDHLNFERISKAIAPNGEQGQIWRFEL